jgi:hypothetical protein
MNNIRRLLFCFMIALTIVLSSFSTQPVDADTAVPQSATQEGIVSLNHLQPISTDTVKQLKKYSIFQCR